MDSTPAMGSASPFPDDMHDVNLQSSMAESSAPMSPAAASPKAPDLPAAPVFPFPRREHALTVRVHSPETASDRGRGIDILAPAHTVFTVETTSTLTSFPKARCEVKRRFSDFQALFDALHHKFAGYFLPQYPRKDLVQGKLVAGKAFLPERARALAIFLTRCCDHPMLCSSAVRPRTSDAHDSCSLHTL